MKKLTQNQIDLYKNLIKSVELTNIELTECKFKKYKNPEEELRIELITNNASRKFSKKNKELLVNYKFEFFIFETKSDKEKKVFELKGTFAISYSLEKKFEKEIIDIFINKNINLNVLPFVRELIHSILPKSGFPPFTIPLFKTKTI